MDLEPVRARLVRRFGPDVNAWVDQVPARIAELADRWRLKVGEPYPIGNSAIAIRCGEVVLKLSPDVEFNAEQVRALQMLAPSGRVPLVVAHDDGAILLETIEPGTPAEQPPPLDDFAALLRDLRTPAGDWAPRRLLDYTEEIFDRVEKRGVQLGDARARRDDLVASQTEEVLLHGDLHLYNVLYGPKLMAIDPKVCLGDPCFDAMDYAFVAKSTDVAKAADLDADRVGAWCKVFAWMA
jgi:streptomycin 6-kinase